LFAGCTAEKSAQRDLEYFEHAFDETLEIETTELRPASVGKSYSAQLRAKGQYKPYRWSLVSGRLPDGMAMDSRGVIEGSPEVPEVATFVVKVVGDTPAGAISNFGSDSHVSSRMSQLRIVVRRASEKPENP
jgi:hypothetical protein